MARKIKLGLAEPKGKKFTADQEEQIARSERLMVRADIIVSGVAVQLKDGPYCGSELLTESATMLIEAADWRARAHKMRDEATKGNDRAFVRSARRRR